MRITHRCRNPPTFKFESKICLEFVDVAVSVSHVMYLILLVIKSAENLKPYFVYDPELISLVSDWLFEEDSLHFFHLARIRAQISLSIGLDFTIREMSCKPKSNLMTLFSYTEIPSGETMGPVKGEHQNQPTGAMTWISVISPIFTSSLWGRQSKCL